VLQPNSKCYARAVFDTIIAMQSSVPFNIALVLLGSSASPTSQFCLPVCAGPMYELCLALRVPPPYPQCSRCVIQQLELECYHCHMHSSAQVQLEQQQQPRPSSSAVCLDCGSTRWPACLQMLITGDEMARGT
jgi:hypothetical protein